MSAIALAELQYGVSVSADPERERANLAELVQAIPALPFDAEAARAYGPIRLASSEIKKDQLEKLIAAHAVALGVTVVTNNIRDFSRYPNVMTENWLTPAEPEH